MYLVCDQLQGVRGRADEREPLLLATLREPPVLREEPVARMDGVRADLPCRLDDRVDVEVTLERRRRADAHGLVRLEHVQRGAVGVRVDDGRRDAHVAARPDHPDSDLTPVDYEDLLHVVTYSLDSSHAGFRFSRNADMPS
jgi:hypothetical protein